MNLRSKNKFRAEVSTSSLSDIMFFLMLFFLITSTMISPSVIKLTLPSSKYHQTVRKTEVSISITNTHQYYINNQLVTLEGLEAELARRVPDPEKVTVVIRCDKDVPVQELINVLQIGNKLKIKMILATKAPNA
ncbi:MAG TPA: biopolymer transporter ExbD [Bacteroidales bacterium]|nr:biopolymer transporter ExbD [Bacteroidales bacterium]HPO66188.1 biopolymer transporter ExbD [Bacteroidales bacterium]